MSPQSTQSTHGDVLTAISDGMVRLLKEFYGLGPTRAKTYYNDDLVVCLLRGGFTRVEHIMCEVFILDPTDLVDGHEIADRRRASDA